MEKGQVIDNCVEIEVIVFSVAGDLHISHVPGGITTKNKQKLSFVRICIKVVHYLF